MINDKKSGTNGNKNALLFEGIKFLQGHGVKVPNNPPICYLTSKTATHILADNFYY